MEFLKLYFKHLGPYDYIGLGIVGIVFLLLFILSLILLFKKPIIGFVLIIISLMFPPLGIYGIKTLLDKTIRRSEIKIKKVEPLHFSNSLLVEANIKNLSKREFQMCLIKLQVIKKSNSKLKRFLYALKPLAIKTIYLYHPIKENSSYHIKKILDGIMYIKNDELTSNIDCY